MSRPIAADPRHWQLAGEAPELYQRHLVPAITAMWAADLAERAAPAPGERVLDLACGTGVVARAAAEKVGQSGSVAGLDMNPGMLAVARSVPSTGAAIEWHEGSALAVPFADGAFDVVLCQLGLQFFPDRPAALREMHRVLAPGGRLGLNVFGPIERNPATNALADALDRQVGPGASLAKRNEHALSDADALRDLVAAAGFRELEVETVTKTVRLASTDEYVRIQFAGTPVGELVAGLDPAARNRTIGAVAAEVGGALARYVGIEELAFPQEMHVLLARADPASSRRDRERDPD